MAGQRTWSKGEQANGGVYESAFEDDNQENYSGDINEDNPADCLAVSTAGLLNITMNVVIYYGVNSVADGNLLIVAPVVTVTAILGCAA